MKKILVIEPYMGGSHRQFIEGLVANIPAHYTFLTLPARSWKMKMQLSAVWCLEQWRAFDDQNKRFDIVLCSTFVDVAVLRALLVQESWWSRETEIYIYFHENQVVYPNRKTDGSWLQFALINFNSAMAADRVAFNSEYNQSTFITGVRQYIKKFNKIDAEIIVEAILRKSIILHPPVDFEEIDGYWQERAVNVPVIVWNHRWEHDKGILKCLAVLEKLKNEGVEFRLILLGQVHDTLNKMKEQVEEKFAGYLLHCGFAESKRRYVELLAGGDIVISCASHEFFGISVLEAVRAGCVPLLPRSLSYPELYPDNFLYQPGDFEKKLKELIHCRKRLSKKEASDLTNSFCWTSLHAEYCRWFGIEG